MKQLMTYRVVHYMFQKTFMIKQKKQRLNSILEKKNCYVAIFLITMKFLILHFQHWKKMKV